LLGLARAWYASMICVIILTLRSLKKVSIVIVFLVYQSMVCENKNKNSLWKSEKVCEMKKWNYIKFIIFYKLVSLCGLEQFSLTIISSEEKVHPVYIYKTYIDCNMDLLLSLS